MMHYFVGLNDTLFEALARREEKFPFYYFSYSSPPFVFGSNKFEKQFYNTTWFDNEYISVFSKKREKNDY